ncbi:MAG: TerB family tellurite resistance protein [Bacteroidota bacterium]
MTDSTPATVPEVLDLSGLTERQQLAFYGALFALAAADNSIHERESEIIFESLRLDALSEDARQRAFALSISPPSLDACLDLLHDADETIRRALMLGLVDVALADDEIEPGEPQTLERVRAALGVTPEDLAAMHTYAYRVRQQAGGKPIARPLACPPAFD